MELPLLATHDHARLFRAIGIVSPLSAPVIGEVVPGGAAEARGAAAGRRSAAHRRAAGAGRAAVARTHPRLGRAGPAGGGHLAHRAASPGAGAGRSPTSPTTRASASAASARCRRRAGDGHGAAGAVDGLWAGAQRVWEVSALSLKLLGRMLVGELSLKNLERPDRHRRLRRQVGRAGPDLLPGLPGLHQRQPGGAQSAAGAGPRWGAPDVLSLEAVTGKPVAGVWLERLQYVGMTLLLAMMAIAMFNDIANRWG